MKHFKFFFAVLLIAIIPMFSFVKKGVSGNVDEALSIKQGKTYWFSYYNNGRDKKLFLSEVYNTDCNYCNNEILAAFKKWLILNDYEVQPQSTAITNLRDDSKSSLTERREKIVIDYKQKGYAVIKVGFSYTEK